MSELASELKSIAAEPHARAAVASYMTSSFAEQRQALERQLTALRDLAPPGPPVAVGPAPGGVGNEAPTLPELPAITATPRSPSRARVVGAVAALALLVAGGVGIVTMFDARPGTDVEPSRDRVAPTSPASEPTPTPEARPEAEPIVAAVPAPSSDAPAPAARVIELAIGRGVASVRVAGVVHEERPVRIELADGDAVELELRGRDGQRAVRSVGAVDDGSTIELPRRRRGGSLWESPY